MNTVKANIEQMNVITKRITLKISTSHPIRQDTKHGLIIVKSKFRKKIGPEQAINLNYPHIRHQRHPQTQKHHLKDNSIKQHLQHYQLHLLLLSSSSVSKRVQMKIV